MTDVDRSVASMGLPSHPTPRDLAASLRNAADELAKGGDDALNRASHLAARGFAAGTIGDGGARSSDTTSSVERAAGITQNVKTFNDIRLPEYADLDFHLAQALRELNRYQSWVRVLVANINHHASDIDPIPVGQGECMACGATCRKAHEEDRLRAGFCPTCYQAWSRAGRPSQRSDWIKERRASLTDAKGIVHIPQPEPLDTSG